MKMESNVNWICAWETKIIMNQNTRRHPLTNYKKDVYFDTEIGFIEGYLGVIWSPILWLLHHTLPHPFLSSFMLQSNKAIKLLEFLLDSLSTIISIKFILLLGSISFRIYYLGVNQSLSKILHHHDSTKNLIIILRFIMILWLKVNYDFVKVSSSQNKISSTIHLRKI